MINDPIVEEIRGFRMEHAMKYDNNLDHIFIALKKHQEEHEYKLVNRENKNSRIKEL